jgi:sulfhydrogenase subunit beta (sulfur reductase)
MLKFILNLLNRNNKRKLSMKNNKISKEALINGLEKAIKSKKIAALTKKQDKYLYDYIKNTNEIVFEEQATVLSPKKFFFPPEEVILDYTADNKITQNINAQPMILFGIRPCDINAIKILDEAFAESNGDPNYLAKRENSIVIGLDCASICNEHAFCYSVKSQVVSSGCDILLHDIGNNEFAIKTYTEKGQELLQQYFKTSPIKDNVIKEYKKNKEQAFSKNPPFKNLEKLPEIFEQNKDHPVWEEEGSKCLSCGACIMVCPTCYCFDVVDELALNLKKGERIRRWDACMLSKFTEVAGGEIFRAEAKNRLKHRINRKFNYLMKKHNKPICIGCGRCVKACLAEISPKKIVTTLTSE